jgi:hypothetical protein
MGGYTCSSGLLQLRQAAESIHPAAICCGDLRVRRCRVTSCLPGKFCSYQSYATGRQDGFIIYRILLKATDNLSFSGWR